jgi:hypothetical protein
MKTIRVIFFSLILISTGCSSNKQDHTEWEKVKNSADFNSFFNFALKVNDTILLQNCIDSIDKYKPHESCIIMTYCEHYNSYNDSLFHENFTLEDECGHDIDYRSRNILVVSIDKYDTVKVKYLHSDLIDYKKALFDLYNNYESNIYLPEVYEIPYRDTTFFATKLATFIYAQILPDTRKIKTSWKTLISTIKEVLQANKDVKDKKSFAIFHSPYIKLQKEQKKLIDNIVSTYVNIYFSNPINKKAPPPPVNYEDIYFLTIDDEDYLL